MNLKQKICAALVFVGSATITACGGGSGPGTQTVNGVVADGYVKGATVFLDKNLNKQFDAGEPSGTTVAGGSYTIANVSSADLAKYPIVVDVPAGAVDSDRGTVTKGYLLTAPAGKPEFVSPLTTLVQNQIEKNGLSLTEAEATVKNQLGLTNLSPLADYKPGVAGASAENVMAAGVAKVIATTIADNNDAIQTAVRNSNSTATVQQVVDLIVQQVMQNISTIVQQVNTATHSGTTALAEAAVSGVVAASNVTVSTSSPTTLQQQLTMAGATTAATTSDILAAVLTTGMYSINQWSNGTANVYSYNKVVITPPSSITFADYRLTNGAWSLNNNNNDLYLTATGWKAETGTVASYDPATGLYTSPAGYEKMNVRTTKIDVSNQLVYPYMKHSFQTTGLLDNLATFPAGSEAFRMTFVPTVDTYRLSDSWDICKTWNSSTNSCTTFASLTEMIGTLTVTNGNWTGSDNGNYGIQFGTLNSSTNSGVLYIGDNTGGDPTSFPVATSTYKLATVHGVQLVIADLTPVGADYTLFAMYNGSVKGGNFRPANVAQLSYDFNFNKTATGAIMQAAKLPTMLP